MIMMKFVCLLTKKLEIPTVVSMNPIMVDGTGMYFRGPRVKLELGLAKGKKLYDKRDSAAARDAKREMDRAIKSRNR